MEALEGSAARMGLTRLLIWSRRRAAVVAVKILPVVRRVATAVRVVAVRLVGSLAALRLRQAKEIREEMVGREVRFSAQVAVEVLVRQGRMVRLR
jgi:hypothetical protein